MNDNDQEFLNVKSSDFVLIGENEIGKVLIFVSGFRD